jgi:hypothetical protein
MSGYPAVVFAPALGVAGYMVCHILLSRFASRRSQRFAIIAGFVIALIFEIGLSIVALRSMNAAPLDCCAFLVLNLLTYASLSFGYFGFVNLNLASLRVRILKEFVRSGRDTLAPDELLADYNAEAIAMLRLTRLIKWKQIVERDGLLYSGKPGFLALAKAVAAGRWIVYGRR